MPDIAETKETRMHRVLVKIPSGKQYLTEKDPRHQKPQKFDTCWHYAHHVLRIRLGKPFDKDYPILLAKVKKLDNNSPAFKKHLVTLKELQAVRAGEKLLADYQNQLSKLQVLKKTAADIQKDLSDPSANALHRELLSGKKIIKIEGVYPGGKTIQLNFLEEVNKLCINTSESTLIATRIEKQIQILNNKYIYKIYKLCLKEKTTNSDILFSSFDHFIWYQILLFNIYHFRFKYSGWHPASSINNLMHILKKNGVLCVHGQTGQSAYKKSNFLYETIDYQMHDLLEINDHDKEQHTVLVFGAEKLATGENYVYIFDPNYNSQCDHKRILFRIPYDQFKKQIKRLFPTSLFNRTYGYHADENYLNEIKRKFNCLEQDIKDITLDVNDSTKAMPEAESKSDIDPNALYILYLEHRQHYKNKLIISSAFASWSCVTLALTHFTTGHTMIVCLLLSYIALLTLTLLSVFALKKLPSEEKQSNQDTVFVGSSSIQTCGVSIANKPYSFFSNTGWLGGRQKMPSTQSIFTKLRF